MSLLIIQNLAVADLLYMTTFVAPAVVSNIANRWVLGDWLCSFTGYFNYLPGSCNLILVSMLSANKLGRCVFPMRTLSIRTIHGVLICAIAWFLSTVLFMEYIILKRGCYFDTSINRCFTLDYADSADYWRQLDFLNVLLFVAVPIITLTISNIWLLCIVFRKHLLQKSTIVMVLSVSCVFWLSWVWIVLYQVVPSNSSTLWVYRMNHYMVWFNNWANPVLYTLTNKRFKRYVTSITPLKFCCPQELTGNSSMVNVNTRPPPVKDSPGGPPAVKDSPGQPPLKDSPGQLQVIVNTADVNVNKAEVNVNKAEVNVNKAEVNVNKAEVNVNKAEVNVNKAEVNVNKADVNKITELEL